MMKQLHKELSKIAPIVGVAPAQGRIDFKDEATAEERSAAQTYLDDYLTNPHSTLRVREMKLTAIDKAESCIREHFKEMWLIDMSTKRADLKTEGLLEGSPTEAVYQWIQQLRLEALSNPQNPNFEQFGAPPYSYEEVIVS